MKNNVYYIGVELLNKETLESLERTIKESGLLTYSVSTAIVQGEARVGKTCLKSLILSLPYDKVSTSCIEAPCIAYGNFSVGRYGSTDGKGWKLVTDDEMDEKIIAEIQNCALGHSATIKGENPPKNKAISKKESDISITSSDTPTVTSESRDGLHTMHIMSNDNPNIISQEELEHSDQKHNNQENNNQEHSNQEQSSQKHSDQEHNYQEHSDQEYSNQEQDKMVGASLMKQTAASNSRIFEHCLEKHGIDRFGLHKEWLYFIDSGGQIQFQKLLLAFMPFTSVLFLVVKLSKDLCNPSCQLIQLPNEAVEVNEHGLKVEEMLKQVLSAVASNTQRYQSLVKDYIEHPTGKLHVITVGTYYDKYTELLQKEKIESVEQKTEKLNDIIGSVSSICDTEKILYQIDGRKAAIGDFKDEHVDKIAKSLKAKAYEVKVPLKWHYFGVILRKEAKGSNGVLTKSSCEEYGRLLDMSIKDVEGALNFFHTLKMLFYYHKSPLAKDIVFVKLDSLVDIIRELVIVICQFRCNERQLPKQMKPQVAKGYLPISLIESTAAFKKITNIPDLSMKLLDLFKHLKIAAQLDDTTLVMPALLPIQDLSDDKVLNNSISFPLLFYFNNAAPMGLFCAVIVHLLVINSWRITFKDDNFSNYFTLEKDIVAGLSLKVVIMEKYNCIEIHCTSNSRHLVKKDIHDAIFHVMKEKLIDYDMPVPGFYCPCSKERHHIARVKKNVFIICENTDTNQDDNILDDEREQYWSWFMNKEEIIVMKRERRKVLDINERKLHSKCIM